MIVDWQWISSDVGPAGYCRAHPGMHCLFSLVPAVVQEELDLGDKELYLDSVLSVRDLRTEGQVGSPIDPSSDLPF